MVRRWVRALNCASILPTDGIGAWITNQGEKMASEMTLVIGGADSGKSVFAEDLAKKHAGPRHYIATAQAFDAEMRAKINRHITRRGPGWQTAETPLYPETELERLPQEVVCLFDCATLWLSNHLLAEHDLADASDRLLAALDACTARLIVVSNEVGHGVVPDNQLGRRFRDAQGRLNIELAALADVVVQVTVGLPRVLKGQLT